ncbi:hypothetical protein D0Z00_002878 [Geotrichum galactomycetum]|uniref:Uncharacterized protein n=1 Tax=Geotrichum galactomycetum TaxID=27317 RepID=A0ACB6V2V2_9ASCO|nr:hypothetical protein D0Z00_002878 [Geotrichum candidum]
MAASSTPAKGSKGPSPLVHKYLVAYNAVSGFLWAAVLARLVILYPLVGSDFVFEGLDEFTRWVQTLMLLEVVHSAIGLVRSPLVTAAMQVASRILVVWGVLYLFPNVGTSFAFSTCVLAWCITEILRYSYYVYTLVRPGDVPYLLTWFRYSAFFILYPLGAGSEWILVLLSLPEAQKYSTIYSLFLKAILLIYIPGFYVMFTHVLAQRRKVFRNLNKKQD